MVGDRLKTSAARVCLGCCPLPGWTTSFSTMLLAILQSQHVAVLFLPNLPYEE